MGDTIRGEVREGELGGHNKEGNGGDGIYIYIPHHIETHPNAPNQVHFIQTSFISKNPIYNLRKKYCGR